MEVFQSAFVNSRLLVMTCFFFFFWGGVSENLII